MTDSGQHSKAGSDTRIDLPIFDDRFKSDPYAIYRELRESREPIVAVRLPTGVDAWFVTSYATGRQLLNDPRLSKDAIHAGPNWHSTHPADESGIASPVFRDLLTIDPPEHTRLRAMVEREFSPRRMAQMRPRIEAIATELLDAVAPLGEADLIETFALPLPIRVICELLGVPLADEPSFRRWSALLVTANLDEQDLIPVAARELNQYLLKLADAKRHEPDESLFSALVAARDEGKLSDDELTALGSLLLVAGHETTVNLIGNGTLALLLNPHQWAKLRDNRELVRGAVEELLRFESPLNVATPRFAKCEIVVDEVRICPGDAVFISLGAANRDSCRFASADQLDVCRESADHHLAFGYGIHYCLGASLARLEGEIAFDQLVSRFPDLRLAIDPANLQWHPGMLMRGLRHLPVQFGPRPKGDP